MESWNRRRRGSWSYNFNFHGGCGAGHTYRGMWFIAEANLEVEIEALDVVEEGAE